MDLSGIDIRREDRFVFLGVFTGEELLELALAQANRRQDVDSAGIPLLLEINVFAEFRFFGRDLWGGPGTLPGFVALASETGQAEDWNYPNALGVVVFLIPPG